MILSDISLMQFRSYKKVRFSLDPQLTLITGKNGIGKTNLLEAIYVLLQGGSFRVADADLIQTDETWWRIDGAIDGEARQVRNQRDRTPSKQLLVHDTAKRFTYKDRLPVVLFEPTDLQLIHGSPARRRDAIDLMLTALSQPYKQTLSRYERALQQRNNILKKQPPNLEDALFSWDVLLSEYGVSITEARRGYVETLNTHLTKYYSQIAGGMTELKVAYLSPFSRQVTASEYIAALHKKLPLDRLRGTTSIGPHRDDIEFYLDGSLAKQSASRGEVRTSLLALKLVYAHLLDEAYQTKPLILLDDVFSELDSERQHNLLSHLKDNQTIITDTKQVEHINGKDIQLS
jgi:DNA replication and repair protein RecF